MPDPRVDVGGVRLFTRRAGSGPPVVVLHGGPGAHHDYLLPQYDLLARGRALWYYDQRGGGQSPVERTTPVGWREHVADLEGLRRHWAFDRLTLLGYSWGGLLALLYALEHPERVAAVALVSTAPAAARWRAEFERRFAERMADPRIKAARAALKPGDRRGAFALSVAGYFRDPERAVELTPFRVTARTQQAVWDSLGEYDLTDRLRRTFPAGARPPALLIHGTFDPMPIEGAREIAALLDAPLVELATGHAPHVEATADFVRALDGFLPKA